MKPVGSSQLGTQMTVTEPKLTGGALLFEETKQALQILREMFLSFPSESIAEIICRRELEFQFLEELIARKADSPNNDEIISKERPPVPCMPFYMKPFDPTSLTTSPDDYY